MLRQPLESQLRSAEYIVMQEWRSGTVMTALIGWSKLWKPNQEAGRAVAGRYQPSVCDLLSVQCAWAVTGGAAVGKTRGSNQLSL